MKDIAKIEALDMTKILSGDVKSEIEKLIDDYRKAKDKEDFIEVTKESSKLILELIEEVYPQALVATEKPCVEVVVTSEQEIKQNKTTAKKETPKKKPQPKAPSKTTTKEILKALQEEVEECRKRGATRKDKKKKTPSIPKTVYDKVYSHINALVNLMPDSFKDDPEKLSQIKRMSLGMYKKVISSYNLNQVLAEKGKKQLKTKFKAISKKQIV